jgi:hypothetical protein
MVPVDGDNKRWTYLPRPTMCGRFPLNQSHIRAIHRQLAMLLINTGQHCAKRPMPQNRNITIMAVPEAQVS